MKKVLLGTSAIVAAGLLSTGVMAQDGFTVGVSGTFGLVSTEQVWETEPPPGHWGDYVNKPIPSGPPKTWLATVTYMYNTADVDGTYTIGAHSVYTTFGDKDGDAIPFELVTGSVTIPPSVNVTAEVEPAGLGLEVVVDSVAYPESQAFLWLEGSAHTIELVSLTVPRSLWIPPPELQVPVTEFSDTDEFVSVSKPPLL